MVVKNRGIRLKERLDPQDQGQRTLLQVSYPKPPGARPEPTPAPTASAKRRAIARMLRVELESTLAMLDRTLEKTAATTRVLMEPAEGEAAADKKRPAEGRV